MKLHLLTHRKNGREFRRYVCKFRAYGLCFALSRQLRHLSVVPFFLKRCELKSAGIIGSFGNTGGSGIAFRFVWHIHIRTRKAESAQETG
jgi:hypothetical protein